MQFNCSCNWLEGQPELCGTILILTFTFFKKKKVMWKMLRSLNAPWQPMLIISRLDSGTQLYICSHPIYRGHINVIFQCSIAHGPKFAKRTWRQKVAEIPIFATYAHTQQCFIVSDIKSPSDKCFNSSLNLINEDNLVHGIILSPNTHPYVSRICFKNNKFRSSLTPSSKAPRNPYERPGAYYHLQTSGVWNSIIKVPKICNRRKFASLK